VKSVIGFEYTGRHNPIDDLKKLYAARSSSVHGSNTVRDAALTLLAAKGRLFLANAIAASLPLLEREPNKLVSTMSGCREEGVVPQGSSSLCVRYQRKITSSPSASPLPAPSPQR
jgi:hypothetical protein